MRRQWRWHVADAFSSRSFLHSLDLFARKRARARARVRHLSAVHLIEQFYQLLRALKVDEKLNVSSALFYLFCFFVRCV